MKKSCKKLYYMGKVFGIVRVLLNCALAQYHSAQPNTTIATAIIPLAAGKYHCTLVLAVAQEYAAFVKAWQNFEIWGRFLG